MANYFNESMNMGPQAGPMSPGGHGQNQHLPAFLMGEPTPASGSAVWSASKGSPPQSLGQSHSNVGSSPSNALNRSYVSPSGMFAPSTRTDIRPSRKEKSGAPPIFGLLENMHTGSPAGGRRGSSSLDISQSHRLSMTMGTPTHQGLITPGLASTPIIPQTKKTPPSPAQRDPFYTQGDSLKADDELNETWVTVFGFPPAATSYILQQFSQYGNIIKHVTASDGNWIHIQYQSKFQAKKALSKNGRVFGGSIMVGVGPCIDKTVMGCDEKENVNTTAFSASFMGTTAQSMMLQQTVTDKLNNSRNTPIRPLTAAYKAANGDNEVVSKVNTPQKNSGIVSKTMEYVFGW